ncbi:MAG: ATP-binding cassette domain-containing protein [Chloroflexi bacterium]|nr:ATP-binding cassette domain-containing protein [Chloroflexota bacterium]
MMPHRSDPKADSVKKAASKPRARSVNAAQAVTHDDIIQMKKVVKTYKNAAGEFIVLKGVDLTIRRGEFVAIVGKSGSGKSTLLNMITGIDHPTDGKVIVNGTDIYAATESQRSLWRGKNLGIVFQFFQLLPMLTLLENVMLPMDYADHYDFEERPKRAMELLEVVGLAEHANKLPLAVSTGQQQMTAVARALATDAPLLVADEPTGNLDSKTASHIIDVFDELVRRGKTIVMVTHDPSLTSRVSRTIIISDGELIDEAVAKSLPLLRHRHMLEITKQARRMTVKPGEVILDCGRPVENLYIISGGAVDVERQNGRGRVISHLRAGEFFGEIELMRGGKAIARVRAGRQPVELLAFPREEFLRIIQESPITAQALGRIVQDRLKEHGVKKRSQPAKKKAESGKSKVRSVKGKAPSAKKAESGKKKIQNVNSKAQSAKTEKQKIK